jgi:hypothetical protein
MNNTMGFCIDATDVGKISFLTRGTAATKQYRNENDLRKGFDFTCLVLLMILKFIGE